MTLEESLRFDCIVVGGGPAELTASLYLARLRRSVLVLDDGRSRAKLIPRIMNLPGFSDGIAGRALLDTLRRQLGRYEHTFAPVQALHVEKVGEGFIVDTQMGPVESRSLIFATGCADIRPELADHDEAVRAGLLRYCPVCDGYEIQGQRVGLLVRKETAAAKSRFLGHLCDQTDMRLVEGCVRLERRGSGIAIAGDPATWNTVYAELGSIPRTTLLKDLGAQLNNAGCAVPADHQRIGLPGVYAIGDMVVGLDQVAVAIGQAAIAATDLHNWLLERDGPSKRCA